jgi:hydroxyacylglutathione hydrolase
MQIECISHGLVQSNIYIVSNNGQAVIVDCGCKPDSILAVSEAKGLELKFVILTHGHFDHIYYVDALRQKAGVQACIHEQDAACFTDPYSNGLALFPVKGNIALKPADRLLKDGDVIECGGLQFHVIHTPGHSKGGICIHVEDALFTGDTLFRNSIGRTDLPGGSMTAITTAIREKLFSLPDETVVYPGHGPSSTIGHEKKHNPYFRQEQGF